MERCVRVGVCGLVGTGNEGMLERGMRAHRNGV